MRSSHVPATWSPPTRRKHNGRAQWATWRSGGAGGAADASCDPRVEPPEGLLRSCRGERQEKGGKVLSASLPTRIMQEQLVAAAATEVDEAAEQSPLSEELVT